jgi:GNAT superfamily N-acetyltransferase
LSAGEYTFERVSKHRLKDIRLLYKASFGEDMSMEFLLKKYDTSEFGANNIGYIAYHNTGEPAAYSGVFPCRAVLDGKTYLCAQSGDTMTHPSHRGKGLFINLAKATYELARKEGIQFVFGFPNDNSYHGFVNKLDWIHKENLNSYKIRVFTFPLAYICNRLGFLSGFYKSYAGFIINRKKSLKKFFDNPLISGNDGGLLRDEGFFNYKNYFDKSIIEINGKCVYVKVSGALRVGDIERLSEGEFLSTLKKLKRLAWILGCYAIYFYYSPGVEYHRFLSQKIAPAKGLAVGWIDFTSGQDLSRLKFSQADLDTY